MRRIRGPNQQGVGCFRWPARQIRSAKIGRVELSPSDLGDAVNAAGGCRGGVPLLRSRQRLTRDKTRFFGGCQACQSQRDAARGACLKEPTTRNAGQLAVGAIQVGPLLRHFSPGQRAAATLETQDETTLPLTDAHVTRDRGASLCEEALDPSACRNFRCDADSGPS
jgi:hypothetical protein